MPIALISLSNGLCRLDRLDYVTNQSDPFFMAITPFTPHIAYQQNKPSHRYVYTPLPIQHYTT